MSKQQLQFDDLKKAELGYTHESRWEINKCCKSIFGGVSWPGKRPGFAVVVAMDKHRHFDSYDICLLAEFESSSTRDLVRQCSVLDYQYEPNRWIGDWKNDAADKFIREMNSERTKQEPKFSVNLTPMLEMEHFYQFALDELRRLLKEDCRQLFLKDSKVVKYLSEIEKSETASLELGDFPAIEAVAFAVISLLDEEKRAKQRPLPTQQDRSYRMGAQRDRRMPMTQNMNYRR
jgi:hypothetical protein